MSEKIYIFAEIKPKPEHLEDARQAIIGILDETRAEDGCQSFELFSAPDNQTLYLFEKWENQDAFDKHHAMPYTLAVFKSYEGWLAEAPRILPLQIAA